MRSVDQLVLPCSTLVATGPAGGRRGVSFAAAGHMGVRLLKLALSLSLSLSVSLSLSLSSHTPYW